MSQPLRLFAVTRKPDSASYQQRVLEYIEPLKRRGIAVTPMTLPTGFGEQRRFIASLNEANIVWWHRHLLPPLLVGSLKGVKAPVVFDFDDPLTFASGGGYRPSLTRRIRFASMLRRCAAALAGSTYLQELARPYCADVHIVPMALTLDGDAPPSDGPVELLWLGSASTQPYLDLIRQPLDELGAERPQVKLRLVAHEPMSFGRLAVDFRRWSQAEQAAALAACHVGLCPMPDTPWTRGKCPFKVLQYMGHRMAWIGSAVGENIVYAGGGSRGVCAASSEQWLAAMKDMVDQPLLRRRLGEQGRQYVQAHHEREALADRLAEIFTSLRRRSTR
ncbi:MAG: hypothetical protein GC162_18665 [Planctomycetes bacterium]|nr:hypothetical protein [Planctomycetota bacterium]